MLFTKQCSKYFTPFRLEYKQKITHGDPKY